MGAFLQRRRHWAFFCLARREARRCFLYSHHSRSSGVAPSPNGSAPSATSESDPEEVEEVEDDASPISWADDVGGLGTIGGVGGVELSRGAWEAGPSAMHSSQVVNGMSWQAVKCFSTQAMWR